MKRLSKYTPLSINFLKLKYIFLIVVIFLSTSSSWAAKKTELSIYEYLKNATNLKTYVKLVEELGFTEKLDTLYNGYFINGHTIFAATDSAFNEFFRNNSWNVTSYENLTISQKKYLLNYSIVKDKYTIAGMSASPFTSSKIFRKNTLLNYNDSITYIPENKAPQGIFWNWIRTKGTFVLNDFTNKPLVFFSQENIQSRSITDEDFETITGVKRSYNDVHIFNSKVLIRDIKCNNGYINIVQSVLIPPKNMAEYINENTAGNPGETTSIFSKLLDRFSAPYYLYTETNNYKLLHPEFTDSIFVKKYLASIGGSNYWPNYSTAKNILVYSPGTNNYSSEYDMGAIFVPSDEAMMRFLNSGIGLMLKSTYGSWDNMPDEIIIEFIKRHMRRSISNSLPSVFKTMVDDANYRLNIKKENIVKTYLGVNGVVYVVNEVFPSADFATTYSPLFFSNNSKIMNWAINISERSVDGTDFQYYKLLLNSSMSKFSLLTPTDEYFSKYIDPIAYGQSVQGAIKYWYNEKTASVNATIYKYDKTTAVVGDSVDIITSTTFLKNRLWDILKGHIVVGDISSGKKYYITKNNDIIRVAGTETNMTIEGGGNIHNSTKPQVTKVINQSNGNTYFLNAIIEPSLKSVYKTLSDDPDFNEFYKLLTGVPDTCINQIFFRQGIDYSVKSFNAYHYTVYVPSNQAILAAINSGKIKTWETIYAMTDVVERGIEINKMIRLLKYHFQDNAVFVGDIVNNSFSTATIKLNNNASFYQTSKNKFYKIGVNSSETSMQLKTEMNTTANVTSKNNIIAKDYVFYKLPTQYKNIDGIGDIVSTLFSSSLITTSSSAVIHQIDEVLFFE